MKKLIVTCVLLAGYILPTNLFAATTVTEEWVAQYNGPANSSDYARDIAVDSSGNVYVTGESYDSGTHYDYATVKYDSDGTQLWMKRYNGPGNWKDIAYAIALDNSGNVYVTGQSFGSGTHYDYATIKYNSDGTQLWVKRYNGTANSSDSASAIAVDSSGNVYIVGSSFGITGVRRDDYVTVKYDTNGTQLWTARYDGPGGYFDNPTSITVDSSGNVYVTGRSYGTWGNGGTHYDYATIKYDSNGSRKWLARYNGGGGWGQYDMALDIALDSLGDVYVTGQSQGVSADYATIKYDGINGTQLWVARYNGPGNGYDVAQAIAVDSSGNVCITGRSNDSGSWWNFDYATVKYDTNGNQLWSARYNGPANIQDEAKGIVMDSSGDVYVTGRSYDSGTSDDYVTIKYDAGGNQQWLSRYNGPGNAQDYPTAMAVDNSGNVYVTGYSIGSGTDYDYITIKYSQQLDPVTAIGELIAIVESLNIQQGIENSLDSKLQNVMNALEAVNADQRQDAIKKLEAFIDAVKAQRSKALTDEQADLLIAKTNDIILSLS